MNSRASTSTPENAMRWAVGVQGPGACAAIKAAEMERAEVGLLCGLLSRSRAAVVPSLQFTAENAP